MSIFAADLLNTIDQFRHSVLEGAKMSAALMELSSRRGTSRRSTAWHWADRVHLRRHRWTRTMGVFGNRVA